MKLSIIIPAYNEEKTIGEIIQKIENINLPIEKEIIVINDGSFDNTGQVLNKLKKERHNFILLEHQKNCGKGAAIETGLKEAKGDIVLIQDADLEYSPNDYPILIRPILRNEVDVVYGSRLLKRNLYHSKFYLWGGKFLTSVVNLLFKVKLTDILTGYKVFKKIILERFDLKEKRFAFCEELTSKLLRNGYQIKEVPIHYKPRGIKDGKKLRWWRDGFRALYVIIKIFLHF